MTVYAEVVLPLPVDRSFFYIVPENSEQRAEVGARVLVPFHRRFLTGFVIKLRVRNPSRGIELKEIERVLDDHPVFSGSFIVFSRKLSRYYYSSWGEVLQASLPPSLVAKSKTAVSLTLDAEDKMQTLSLSGLEKKVLSLLQKGPYSQVFLKRRFREKNISSLLSRLEKRGLIERTLAIPRLKSPKSIDTEIPVQTQLEIDFSLDKESRQAAEVISRTVGKQVFSPFLLQAEAEKREAVYFSVIRSSLASGKRVLFMLPEIALTHSLLERLKKKLGERASVLHSRLSASKRLWEWSRIREGKADIVVGPRSALLSPIDNLGLIIVDEQQDPSYYQRQSPVFDAGKGAWIRAKHEGLVLVYGSSFPSVEAVYRAKKKGYFLQIPSRSSQRRVNIIRGQGEKRVLSLEVLEKIRVRLQAKEPVLVFCNRRGYASFLSCSRCSYIPECVHCEIALSYHKKEKELVCHYCRYTQKHPDVCPECGSRIIRERGHGIEAIEEGLRGFFPHRRIVSFDKDAAGDRASREQILDDFLKGDVDILLGTQLLAHQYNWPRVSLVVVYRPEMALALSDYRAGQNLFHAIYHMTRFLKETEDSEMVVQTSLPDHYSILYAANFDYRGFFKREIRYRKMLDYPPFTYLAEVIFQGENLRTLAKKTRAFSSLLIQEKREVDVLGPALPPVSRIRGINRIQVVLKARRKRLLDEALGKPLTDVKAKKTVYVYE